MWHCPQCGAPQAETARCWVCRRSSTTCSTCTHFRRALAGDLAYCGLDARRLPLTGLEQRGCWEPKPVPVVAEGSGTVPPAEAHRLRGGRRSVDASDAATATAPRTFVPVESLNSGRAMTLAPAQREKTDAPRDVLAPVPAPAFVIEPEADWAERTSLFGDPEG